MLREKCLSCEMKMYVMNLHKFVCCGCLVSPFVFSFSLESTAFFLSSGLLFSHFKHEMKMNKLFE